MIYQKGHSVIPNNTNPIKTPIAFDNGFPNQTEKLLHPLNEEEADIFLANQLPLEDNEGLKHYTALEKRFALFPC